VEIIPVIDLLGGIVVRAGGGERRQYPPLSSQITLHSDPVGVITDLLKLHDFKTIYLADLEAIFEQRPAWHLYKELQLLFPTIRFLIDAGIQQQQQADKLSEMGVIPVFGSETLSELALLQHYQHAVLSLDFHKGSFLGNKVLLEQPALWPNSVIAMNIDKVGNSNGVDLVLLDRLRKLRSNVELIAAGGVRNQQDIMLLEQRGLSGVLVASALHDARLKFE